MFYKVREKELAKSMQNRLKTFKWCDHDITSDFAP